MEKKEETLTSEKYWNRQYRRTKFKIPKQNDKIIQFLDNFIPDGNGKECIEIGCFPCGYLAYVGKRKHYTINGIDFCDCLDEKLFEWLHRLQLKIGDIKKENFLEYNQDLHKQFDLVYSLGFIEHFTQYKEVIQKHDCLVKKGGRLIITTPNCAGWVQYILKKIFYPECFRTHNIKSMNPKKWTEILEKKGYSIEFSGYFGGFCFWRGKDEITGLKKYIYSLVEMISTSLSSKKLPNCSAYSPFCGIVAIKK